MILLDALNAEKLEKLQEITEKEDSKNFPRGLYTSLFNFEKINILLSSANTISS